MENQVLNLWRAATVSFLLALVAHTIDARQNRTFADIDPKKVTIVRDQWGLPHIYAERDCEVAYGVAWAQSEDNFELIQQTMLFTKGLLGRVYGKEYAGGDFLTGLLRIDELVDSRINEDVSPEFMAYLDGFCQGLNAFADAHPNEVLHKKLFPVTVQEILASYPLKIAEFIGMGNVVGAILSGKQYDQLVEDVDLEHQSQRGSNAFAFSSKVTTNGRTYFISNPHVSISGPEAFYEMHLVSEEGLNFHGAMFPGSVSPQIGTNTNLGWSHTNNYYDHTDVFLLEMHPDKPLHYKFDGQWIALEEIKLKLKVKLKALPFPLGVKRKVYWSKYGPTLKTKKGHFLAIRMAPIFTIKTAEQWFRMNKASNLEEFKEALSMNGLSYFNITYADKADNVFYIFNGLFPERTAGYDWEHVVPGNTSETLWDSYVPLGERPQILNPTCGYVYNVNHSPFKCTCEENWLHKTDYDTLVGYDRRDDNTRSLRFREIYQGQPISMDQLKAIKYDTRYPEGGPFAETIRQLQQYQNDTLEDVLSLVRNWDLTYTMKSTAVPAAYLYDQRFSWLKRQKPEEDVKTLMADALYFAKDHLLKYFGKTEVALAEFSRIKRGDKDLPVYGFSDLLGNRWSKLDPENGRLYATGGDNFMMFVQYDESGVVEFESIVPFGNSNRPESPHYNDQMEMYAEKKAKTLTFDKDRILESAERIYHPQ
jgi:acyl-homoserine-lactone acylase